MRHRMLKEDLERQKLLTQLGSKLQKRRQKIASFQEEEQNRQPHPIFVHPCQPNESPFLRRPPSASRSCLEDDVWADQEALQQHESSNIDHIQEKWSHLITAQKERFQQQAMVLERTDIAALKRIVAGYYQHFAVFLEAEDSIMVDAEMNECPNGTTIGSSAKSLVTAETMNEGVQIEAMTTS